MECLKNTSRRQSAYYVKENTFTKSHDPKFANGIYTVTHVSKAGGYSINNKDHRRIWLRHELRLIKAAEDKDTES